MRVLAFDIAVKHFSFCVLEKDKQSGKITVVQWKLLELPITKWKQGEPCLVLFDVLEHHSSIVQDVTLIVIEEQPMINCKTSSLSFGIQMYFMLKYPQIPVRLQNGALKLRAKLPEASSTGKQDQDLLLSFSVTKKSSRKKRKSSSLSTCDVVESNKKEQLSITPKERKSKYKSKYKENKKKAVLYTRLFLATHHKEEENFTNYFLNSKKKDDLADSYLHALYALQQHC